MLKSVIYMREIEDGWLKGVRKIPSPHFNQRPTDSKISLIVVHNISLPPGEFTTKHIDELFLKELKAEEHPFFETIQDYEVSSHLLIDRKGELTQYVSLLDRAWHAGESNFQGTSNCNDFSIGIELVGTDEIPFTQAQYETLAAVTRFLMTSYPEISAQNVVGHSEVSPGRKSDPGDSFDWSKFRTMLGTQPSQP